jgi:hypothetical protein
MDVMASPRDLRQFVNERMLPRARFLISPRNIIFAHHDAALFGVPSPFCASHRPSPGPYSSTVFRSAICDCFVTERTFLLFVPLSRVTCSRPTACDSARPRTVAFAANSQVARAVWQHLIAGFLPTLIRHLHTRHSRLPLSRTKWTRLVTLSVDDAPTLLSSTNTRQYTGRSASYPPRAGASSCPLRPPRSIGV